MRPWHLGVACDASQRSCSGLPPPPSGEGGQWGAGRAYVRKLPHLPRARTMSERLQGPMGAGSSHGPADAPFPARPQVGSAGFPGPDTLPAPRLQAHSCPQPLTHLSFVFLN